MIGVDDPPPRDRRHRRRQAEAVELVHGHDLAAAQLGRRVETGQLLPAGGGGTPAAQLDRLRVEDGDTAEDRVASRVAQQTDVTGTQRQGPAQLQADHQPGQRTDPHRDGRRSDVQGQLAGAAQRRVGSDLDVDRPGRRPGARGQEGVSPAYVLVPDPPQVHRHPGNGRDTVARPAQGLERADGHSPAAHVELVTGVQGAGSEGAGDDRSGAADREGPVDPEPDRRVQLRWRQRPHQPEERRAQVVEAGAGVRADRQARDQTHGGPSQPLGDVRRDRAGVGQVGAGDRYDGVPDAESVQCG